MPNSVSKVDEIATFDEILVDEIPVYYEIAFFLTENAVFYEIAFFYEIAAYEIAIFSPRGDERKGFCRKL